MKFGLKARGIIGVTVAAAVTIASVGLIHGSSQASARAEAAERKSYSGSELVSGLFFGTGQMATDHPSLAPAASTSQLILDFQARVISRVERSNASVLRDLEEAVRVGRRPAILDALEASQIAVAEAAAVEVRMLPSVSAGRVAPMWALTPVAVAVAIVIAVAVTVAATANIGVTINIGPAAGSSRSRSTSSSRSAPTTCGVSRPCRSTTDGLAPTTSNELLVDEIARSL
jgi:SdpC family antimicrobial peptide